MGISGAMSFQASEYVDLLGLGFAVGKGLGLSGRPGTKHLWQSTSEGPVAGTNLAKKLTLRLTGSLSHQMQRDPLNCAIDPSRTGRQIPADFYSLDIRTRRRLTRTLHLTSGRKSDMGAAPKFDALFRAKIGGYTQNSPGQSDWTQVHSFENALVSQYHGTLEKSTGL